MGGGEENKRSYVPGGQALMMGLQKSHSWWHRHGAAISGAPSGLWLETLIELRKVSEAAVCAWGGGGAAALCLYPDGHRRFPGCWRAVRAFCSLAERRAVLSFSQTPR